jgi:hypothetical protein
MCGVPQGPLLLTPIFLFPSPAAPAPARYTLRGSSLPAWRPICPFDLKRGCSLILILCTTSIISRRGGGLGEGVL